MEKRMILAIALSIAVLLGYQHYFSSAPPPTKGAGAPAGTDNGAVPVAAPARPGEAPATAPVTVGPGGLAPRAAAPARKITVKTPLYTATIATAGGGIPSFLLNEY